MRTTNCLVKLYVKHLDFGQKVQWYRDNVISWTCCTEGAKQWRPSFWTWCKLIAPNRVARNVTPDRYHSDLHVPENPHSHKIIHPLQELRVLLLCHYKSLSSILGRIFRTLSTSVSQDRSGNCSGWCGHLQLNSTFSGPSPRIMQVGGPAHLS